MNRPQPIGTKAIFAIVDQGWMTPPTVPMRTLVRMSELGMATQCGRLFHPTTEARRIADLLRRPEPQGELFA